MDKIHFSYKTFKNYCKFVGPKTSPRRFVCNHDDNPKNLCVADECPVAYKHRANPCCRSCYVN